MKTLHFKILNLILCCSVNIFARNPFLPPTAFIPDGEPHVFEYKGENRLFVYGSRDERITGYCGYGHDVWSAPVNDLTKWTNHGEIFNIKQVWDIGYGIIEEQHFGAPDCVYNPITKKYYLYTFLGHTYKMDGKQGPLPGTDNYIPGFDDWGPKCVMAVSDNPTGPFTNPVMCDWPAENEAGTFDPSVLVDEREDGSIEVYAYWGMKKGDRWAQLDPKDMHTIINPTSGKADVNAWHKTLDPKQVTNSTVFEASSIKKIDNNNYVFIYSSNERKSALTYCYSQSPKGPWKFGGEIIRNDIDWKGGNNHGSIVKVLDRWYVVYHRPTNNSKNRQAMIDPIELKVKNTKIIIPSVEMTSQGIETKGLNPYQRYNAYIACFRTNNAFINSIPRQLDGLNPISDINGPSTTIGFKHFNFGDKKLQNKDSLQLKLNCDILHPTRIFVMVAHPNDANLPNKRVLIAETNLVRSQHGDLSIPISDIDHNTALKKIGGLKGKLSVFISFRGKGEGLCEFKELEFAKANNLTPNPLHSIRIQSQDMHLISSIPNKSRQGESVKLSINSKTGYQLSSIKAYDDQGKSIHLEQNGLAPYAPLSYHFFMPNSEVKVQATYTKN